MTGKSDAPLITKYQSTNASNEIDATYIKINEDANQCNANVKTVSKAQKILLMVLMLLFIAHIIFSIMVFVNLSQNHYSWQVLLIFVGITRLITFGAYNASCKCYLNNEPVNHECLCTITVVGFIANLILSFILSVKYWFGDDQTSNGVIFADVIITTGVVVVFCTLLLISILYSMYKFFTWYYSFEPSNE